MKTVVLILFAITSAFTQSYEDAIKKHRESGPIVQHPEYEVEKFDRVEFSELMCCLTKTNENASPINYPQVPKHPIQHRESHPKKKEQITRYFSNIFHRVLSETLLKIIYSVLKTFEGDAELRQHHKANASPSYPKQKKHFSHSNRPMLNIFAVDKPIHKLDIQKENYLPQHFVEAVRNQPIVKVLAVEEPMQDNRKEDYNCEMMPMGWC